MNYNKIIIYLMLHLTYNSVLNAFQQKIVNGIVPYMVEHEPAVKKIALEHMPRLVDTWTFTEEEYQKRYLVDVKPALEDSQYNPKVYVENGKPVGFVTYRLSKPAYAQLLPKFETSNATIHHLAIDSKYAKKGYGSKLLKNAIDDCKDKSAQKVSLITTDPNLDTFYTKFGFKLVMKNKIAQSKYVLKLKPHPALYFVQEVLKYWKK